MNRLLLLFITCLSPFYTAFSHASEETCTENQPLTEVSYRVSADVAAVKEENSAYKLVVDTEPYVYGQDKLTVAGTLTVCTDKNVTDFVAYYAYNGQTCTKKVTGLSLKKDESYSFSFDETLPLAVNDTVRYEVWAEVNGEVLEKIACQTVPFSFKTHRRTVFEVGTALWCGYCPKGIVATRMMSEKYPEDFICIDVHGGDVLQLKDYINALGLTNYPSAKINRKAVCERPMTLVDNNGKEEFIIGEGGFETYFLNAQKEPAVADIDLTAVSDGNQIKVTAETRFSVCSKNHTYQLALVVVEDKVTLENECQKNNFSGAGFSMGGFESQPYQIRPAVCEHVARTILDDFNGIPGSIPAEIKLEESYTFEYPLTLPATVVSEEEVRLVALLLDKNTGEIVNANTCKMSPVGIDSETATQQELVCVQEGDACAVSFHAEKAGAVKVCLYRPDGSLVYCTTSEGESGVRTCRLPLSGESGLFVVTLQQDNQTQSVKFLAE